MDNCRFLALNHKQYEQATQFNDKKKRRASLEQLNVNDFLNELHQFNANGVWESWEKTKNFLDEESNIIGKTYHL